MIGINLPFLWLLVASSACVSAGYLDGQLHLAMNKTHLQQIFKVEDHHKVPEYEVVKLKPQTYLHITSNQKIKLLPFIPSKFRAPLVLKQNLNLLSNAEVYSAGDKVNGEKKKVSANEFQAQDLEGYHDTVNDAALVVTKDALTGQEMMKGRIGNLTLSPIYQSVINSMERNITKGGTNGPLATIFKLLNEGINLIEPGQRRRPNRLETVQRERDGLIDLLDGEGAMHVVYKKHAHKTDPSCILEAAAKESKPIIKNLERRKRNVGIVTNVTDVETIYPQIVLVADHTIIESFNGSAVEVTNHYVNFWNSLQLVFSKLSYPKVELHFAGLVIGRINGSQFYNNSRIYNGKLPAPEALLDFGHYLYNNRIIKNYDIALLFTKLDLKHVDIHPDGLLETDVEGAVWNRGACTVFDDVVYAAALVEDITDQDMVVDIAAHKIGNLLGAVGDGLKAGAGPGAASCSSFANNVMARNGYVSISKDWSKCTRDQINYFARQPYMSCLLNNPDDPSPSEEDPPLSLDQQCNKRLRGSVACSRPTESVCQTLYCKNPTSRYCESTGGALIGTECGSSNGVCLNGTCLEDVDLRLPFN